MAEYYERDALIDALMMYTWRDEDDREIDDSDAKRAFIEEWFPHIPAADVRPVVRGRWLRNGWSIRCSECGYDMPFSVRNFCPNCGARMEKS